MGGGGGENQPSLVGYSDLSPTLPHKVVQEDFGNATGCSKYQLCFTLLGDLEQVISNPPGLHSLAIKRVHVYTVKPYGLWSWRPRWQTALPPTSHMIIGEVTQHPCASVPQPLLPNRGHKTARASYGVALDWGKITTDWSSH